MLLASGVNVNARGCPAVSEADLIRSRSIQSETCSLNTQELVVLVHFPDEGTATRSCEMGDTMSMGVVRRSMRSVQKFCARQSPSGTRHSIRNSPLALLKLALLG